MLYMYVNICMYIYLYIFSVSLSLFIDKKCREVIHTCNLVVIIYIQQPIVNMFIIYMYIFIIYMYIVYVIPLSWLIRIYISMYVYIYSWLIRIVVELFTWQIFVRGNQLRKPQREKCIVIRLDRSSSGSKFNYYDWAK